LIAITGASGQVGTLLCERLADRSIPHAPLGRDDDWTTAIRSARAVAHLAGTLQPRRPDTYETANVRTTETVAAAARAASVERIVFLSYVGASPESPNAYLRSKARAEAVLLDNGVPTTVFRCLHVYGPPERPGPTAGAFLKGRGPVVVLGDGSQRIAPLFVGDVVEAILRALLDAGAPTGVFDLGGPREMTMDAFVRTLNRGEVRIAHLPAPLARAAGALLPYLTPALVDLLVGDNLVGGERSAADAFELSLHRLEEVWADSASVGGAAPG
jgi:NAD(P)H dehydrogenase (quinone)